MLCWANFNYCIRNIFKAKAPCCIFDISIFSTLDSLSSKYRQVTNMKDKISNADSSQYRK